MHLSLEKRTRLSFGLVFVMVAFIGVVAYFNAQEFINTNRLVSHTLEVLGELESTLSTIITAEDGQRGYIITGLESYLAPYNNANATLGTSIEGLRRLTADNPDQQQRLDTLEALVNERFDIIQQTINLRRDVGFEAAQEVVMTGRGKQLMDEILRVLADMVQEETELLAVRRAASETITRSTLFAFALLTALTVGLLGFIYYLISRDLTKRKRVEQALRLSEERWRSVVQNVPDGITTYDRSGIIQFTNRIPPPLTVEDVIGRSIYEFSPPDQRAMMEQAVHKVLETGESTSFEMTSAKSGIYYTIHFGPIMLDGQIIGFITSTVDITNLRRREAQVAYQANLLTNVNDAIVATDKDHIVTFWNRAAEEIYGWSAEEIVGRKTKDILHSEISDTQQRELLQQMAEVGHYRLELVQYHKNGTPLHIERTSIALRDEQGQITGYVSVNRNITERKRKDAEIAYQARLLTNVNDAILATDTQSKVTYWNRAAEQIYGWTADEIMGKSARDMLHSQLTDEQRLEILKQLEKTGNYHIEVVHQRKDGTKINIEATSMPLSNEQGQIIGYVSVNRDVTERKRTEKTFRELLESAPDAMVIVNREGNITLINMQTQKMFGYTAEELIGQSVEILVPQRFRSQHPEQRMDYLNDPKTRAMGMGMELYALCKDGSEFPVEISLSPLETEDGMLVSSAIRDITQRKKIEEEIYKLNAELEERVVERTTQLAFLAEASRVLSESFDYTGRLKELAQLTVPQIADWCSIDILDDEGRLQRLAVVHTDPAKVEYAYELARRFPADPNASTGSYQVVRSGKSEFYPEINVAMFANLGIDQEMVDILEELGLCSSMTVPLLVHGHVLGVLSLVMAESGRHYGYHDLELAEDLARRAALLIDNARLYQEAQTLNAELEQRVTERTIQLEVSNKELEAFSYSVSHDLRAPLRSIDGFSQALLEDYHDQLDSEGKGHLHRVRAASQRMAELIDDLINLSRMSRAEMQREAVNLSAIAHGIAVDLQEQQERDVEFVIAEGLVTNGDKQLLRVVLENLLGNAWKFTSKCTQARIEFGAQQQDDGKTAYFVRDNGDGFDMAHADKLFGAFQRLHAMTDFEGTGIGLATVKRIIHRHGGRVWAEGVVGKGATFYFTL